MSFSYIMFDVLSYLTHSFHIAIYVIIINPESHREMNYIILCGSLGKTP